RHHRPLHAKAVVQAKQASSTEWTEAPLFSSLEATWLFRGRHMPDTATPGTTTLTAIRLLGGEDLLHARPRVPMDWIPLLRQGLPSASLDVATRLTRITQNNLARALGIPER